MRLILWLTMFTLALPSVVDARHRTHVRITKPYAVRSVQPIVGPAVAIIPPLALFYDLTRRTNCQGDTLGLGGPGFSSPLTPATGNVMTTAYMRGECATPK